MAKLMPVALMLFLAAGLAVGCGGANNSGNGGEATSSAGAGASTETNSSSGTTSSGTAISDAATRETGGTSESTGGTTINSSTTGTGDVRIERLSSGTMGPEERQIIVASSAGELAAAIGQRVPDSGQGAYIAVAWDEKPTGGYTVGFGSAGVDGVRLEVGVELMDPPQDAMVAQALTYPYSVAVIKGVDLGEKELVLVNQDGREIDWPIINV